MGLSVDLTVRLGDILTMLGLFGGGIVVVAFMRSDMKILAQRVGALESQLSDIKKILIEQARHDQRILQLEQDMRDLKK